jgi:hypothetical protein
VVRRVDADRLLEDPERPVAGDVERDSQRVDVAVVAEPTRKPASERFQMIS